MSQGRTLLTAVKITSPRTTDPGSASQKGESYGHIRIALLGKEADGLSASTIGRLKDGWSEEHARWSKRDLSAKRYVYFWVDGIHVQARLEDAAQCLLVIIGATPEGKKELVGLIDGVRESAQSWKELLLDLKRRGLAMAPELAVADGALGFWQATRKCGPDPRPALLGAQDRQCAEQAAKEPAIESQAGAEGDKDGRKRRARQKQNNNDRRSSGGSRRDRHPLCSRLGAKDLRRHSPESHRGRPAKIIEPRIAGLSVRSLVGG